MRFGAMLLLVFRRSACSQRVLQWPLHKSVKCIDIILWHDLFVSDVPCGLSSVLLGNLPGTSCSRAHVHDVPIRLFSAKLRVAVQ